MEMVYLEWIDTAGPEGWSFSTPSVALCKTVAFVLEETEDAIIVTPTIARPKDHKESSYHAPMAIPKCSIKRDIRFKHIPQKGGGKICPTSP